MPELPEVETSRRILARYLEGRTLQGVAAVRDPIVYEGVSPRRFRAALEGRRVRSVRRRGKHLWLEMKEGPSPLFHFGMTGNFHVYRETAERPRFWKVELLTDRGIRLAMTNARRLGRIRLRQDPLAEPPLSRLGFDPLEGLPPVRVLERRLERREAPIKTVLLDQHLFAGVGNWIADEVLYQAGIDPRRAASGLDTGEVRRLRTRLHAVIRRAVEVSADDSRFPRTWLFHHRWGRDPEARTGRGETIRHITLGGRTTAWVPSRQR